MAAKRPSTLGKYEKSKIMAALKDTVAAYEANARSYEDDVKSWRETAPQKFIEYVAAWDPKNPYLLFGADDFLRPPKQDKYKICGNFEMIHLNREIARVDAMPDGIVTLRSNDPLWQWVGMAACL